MNATTDQRRGMVSRLHWVKRWMYRTGRPGALARVMNRISAVQFSAGVLSPARAVTLEVPGRRTGRLVSFPVVAAEYEGGRYLVSMLGKDANWVLNVRAAGGRVVLRRSDREEVRLEEVEPGDRAPILRRYLALAPGARPHLPVDRSCPARSPSPPGRHSGRPTGWPGACAVAKPGGQCAHVVPPAATAVTAGDVLSGGAGPAA